MAFKVFISYSGNDDEQSVVWRLQTLAAAQGIQAYVPRRTGGSQASRPLRLIERVAIDDADIVVAIITSRIDRPVENEQAYAPGLKKGIVPIVYQDVDFPPRFQNFPALTFAPF